MTIKRLRKRRKKSQLKRRYGCFRLPEVRGARVSEAKQKDASWLARTDPAAKTIEFSEAWAKLSDAGKEYIVLHERAHLETGPDHNSNFYDVLKRLIKANGVSWEIAYELESFNCHKRN